jgi:hypothetical protein
MAEATSVQRALSIRQPYAELILRGEKTIEYRTRPTQIVGEPFYIYAAGKWPVTGAKRRVWSSDLSMPGPTRGLPWMLEMARGLAMFDGELPTGVLVGSACIERVEQRADGMFAWHLSDVRRLATAMKPQGHPQPTWWFPFGKAA